MRFIAGVFGAILIAGGAAAADYPCSTVRLIVPYAAGGATDVAARLVAERLEPALKRPVITENRAGATGNIGTVAVIKSKPDGCTLLVNAAVIATFPHSFSKLGYDPIKDLLPIGGIGETPTLVVSAPVIKADNLNQLIDLAKGSPAGLTYATAGYGLLQHLAVEELAVRSGVKLVHVPYKGGAQAVTDLVAARLDFGSFAAGSVGRFVAEGKLKALGVIQERRSALAPEVPTIVEQGLPALNASVHFMLFAPAGSPKDLVERLSGQLRDIVGDPAMKDRFLGIGFEPTPISSAQAAEIMRRTSETWAPLIKRLDIRLD